MNNKVYVVTLQGYVPCEGFYDVLKTFSDRAKAYDFAESQFKERLSECLSLKEAIAHEVDEDCLSFEIDACGNRYFYNFDVCESELV